MPAVTAHISLKRLSANYGYLRDFLRACGGSDTTLMAVIKGDAYGHGAPYCAHALARDGVEWFGVTSVAEGIAVRNVVMNSARILVMRGLLPEEAHEMLYSGLTPVLWTPEQVDALEAAVSHLGLPARSASVHLEIDTGMCRQGVQLSHLQGLLSRLQASEWLKLEAVMTHFASADDLNSSQTCLQMRAFAAAIRMIRAAGLRPSIIHAGNTSAIDARLVLSQLRELATDAESHIMCRAGIGLYGYALKLCGTASTVRAALEPVLTWKTKVLSVYSVEPGERVGYNGTFTADRTLKLALLPVGYADGLRRELSNTGHVLVTGRRARIVGRISMDMTVIDITEIPDVKPGDDVMLIGTDGTERITAEDHARVANTIPYEILCGINARVPRVYYPQLRGDIVPSK